MNQTNFKYKNFKLSNVITNLVIADLLNVKVAGIEDVHPGEAVVADSQRRPFRWIWNERVHFLLASGRAADEVHRRLRIRVRMLDRTVVDFAVVDRPEPLVNMFVRPNFHIHSVLVEEIFQTVRFDDRETFANQTLLVAAIVSIVIAAVHRTWLIMIFIR